MVIRSLAAVALAVAVQLVLPAALAHADDVNSPPGVEVGSDVEMGPAVEIGAAPDPFVSDLVDMISEGRDLAPTSG